MRCLLLLTATVAVCLGQPKAEVGEINGAQFRIDVPAEWNGVLIVYCHGYADKPGTFTLGQQTAASGLAAQGYAVAQSGYASGGYAVEQALVDIESLRRYFVRKYGAAKETYLVGHSMGGQLTMAMLETYPTSYDGGLALCGVLGSSSRFLLRYFFDGRVVFDYYFPGLLPSPAKIPKEWTGSLGLIGEIKKQMAAQPEKAAVVRTFLGLKSDGDVAGVEQFFTTILQELQQRTGGNAFDNRNTIYQVTGDRNALNDGIARYEGGAKAAAYLQRYYTPTGQLKKPMLALHTTYDPIVPPWIANDYSLLAAAAGSSSLFVQQYARHDGHCTMTPAETVGALGDLRAWVTKGVRPAPGLRK